MSKAKKWIRVEHKAPVADIFIFGLIGDWIDDLMEDIGWGFDSVQTAKKFQAELDALPEDVKELRLHVNSPGGDVFGAVTIANMLRDQRTVKGRRVEASVEGLAASAASIVIQAGDPIRIADNGLIMIHDPWTGVRGNARELREVADELDKVKTASLIATYKWNSSLSEKEIGDLMAATTWLDADEAVEWGFATEKVSGLKAAAALTPKDISVLSIPEKYRDRVAALLEKGPADGPKAPAPADVLRLCREAECLDLAEELITAGASLEDVKARIASAAKARAAAAARAKEIHGLCATAQFDELAEGYITGGMSIEAVRAHLTTITAKMDRLEIDGSIDPDHGRPDAAGSWERAFSRASRRFGARA